MIKTSELTVPEEENFGRICRENGVQPERMLAETVRTFLRSTDDHLVVEATAQAASED